MTEQTGPGSTVVDVGRVEEEPAAPAPAAGDLLDVAAREARVVVAGLSELFIQVDNAIRPRSALVGVEVPRSSHADDQTFEIYECELRPNGKVRLINLERRARELQLLYPFQVVSPVWTRPPTRW
jgi:hypothetical protein